MTDKIKYEVGKEYKLGDTAIHMWDTLKPGDLCIVTDGLPRIFAGIKKGCPATYDASLTDTLSWLTCRPLTPEELAKIKKGV